jgi:glycosyltransferase involved in cell wall biosynthesis
MRIFALMLLRDEADIIAPVLSHCRGWADRIIIQDNGSSDGTWEIAKSMADDVIVPWKRDLRPYDNTLRADAFNAFRHDAEEDDWWCYKLDADEFYVDNPREFLEAVPWPYHVVMKKSLDYVITHEDVSEQNFTGSFDEDWAKIRYLKPQAHTEARFFRHRRRLVWESGTIYPRHRGPKYPKPILVKHYQYRSPQQIQARLDLRNSVPKDPSGKPFRHIKETDWREVLVPRSEAVLDKGQETYHRIPIRDKTRRSGVARIVQRVAEHVRRILHAVRILP